MHSGGHRFDPGRLHHPRPRGAASRSGGIAGRIRGCARPSHGTFDIVERDTKPAPLAPASGRAPRALVLLRKGPHGAGVLSKSSTLTASALRRGARRESTTSGSGERARDEPAARPVRSPSGVLRSLDRIKREKGVWWMPWQQEAMKDVIPCDKPWGAGNRLRSMDLRMGQPT